MSSDPDSTISPGTYAEHPGRERRMRVLLAAALNAASRGRTAFRVRPLGNLHLLPTHGGRKFNRSTLSSWERRGWVRRGDAVDGCQTLIVRDRFHFHEDASE